MELVVIIWLVAYFLPYGHKNIFHYLPLHLLVCSKLYGALPKTMYTV